jgi:hypothetical protein
MEDQMKQSALLIALLAAFSVANAECILRTTSVTKVTGHIDEIVEIKPIVTPTSKTEKSCSITARVLYKAKWYSVMDSYTGANELDDVERCTNAVELSVRRFLASMESPSMHNEQQMVCSEEPELKYRKVKIGDVVQIAEVAPHPTSTATFTHKGAMCRWFVEDRPNTSTPWQGIICKQNQDPKANNWVVVDKF